MCVHSVTTQIDSLFNAVLECIDTIGHKLQEGPELNAGTSPQ
jgi:hypothetical protein